MALNEKGPEPKNTEVCGKNPVTLMHSEIIKKTLVVPSKAKKTFIKTFILGLMLRSCNWLTQLLNYYIA